MAFFIIEQSLVKWKIVDLVFQAIHFCIAAYGFGADRD